MEIYRDLNARVDKILLLDMCDLKLFFLDFFFLLYANIEHINCICFNFIDPFFFNGFTLFNFKTYYQFTQNTTLIFAFKFLLCISFLVLIRGGTPRYRYDYLTKLGWLKFVSLVLFVFIISIFFLFLY